LRDVHLEHFARRRTGHLHRRFAGLDFQDALILSDDVPFLHQEFEHITRIDAVAEVRKFDFDGHGKTGVSREW